MEHFRLNDHLNNLLENKKSSNIFPTGFEKLDKLLFGGFEAGEVNIIGGRPGMGKTAFVLSVAYRLQSQNIQTSYITYNKNITQVADRIIKMKIGFNNTPHKELEELYKIQIKDFQENHNGDMLLYKPPHRKISALLEYITECNSLFKTRFFVIDFLQYLADNSLEDFYYYTYGNETVPRDIELQEILIQLKDIASKLNVAILVLSSINRKVDLRGGDRKPILSDLLDCEYVEYIANKILFVHRPEYYGFYEDENGDSLIGKAEIMLMKNDSGSIGDIELKFIKHRGLFEDLDK